MKIEFGLKSFKPGQVPVPLITVKVIHEDNHANYFCIVDSGADFCTIPMAFGRLELGIDFGKNKAPYELVQE